MIKLTRKDKIRLAAIERHGSEEAWREAMAEYGKKGGKARKTKPSGFAAMTPKQRREVSRKGLEKRWGNGGGKE